MRFSKVYVDRNQFSKRLGVDINQVGVANVEYNLNEVTITLAVDESAEVNSNVDAVTQVRGGDNIRRFRLIDNAEEIPEDPYAKVFYYIDKSIQEMKLIQEENKEDTFPHTQALKTQIELERVKLDVLKHNVNLKENAIMNGLSWTQQ